MQLCFRNKFSLVILLTYSLLAVGLLGCIESTLEYDPSPIAVNLNNGVVEMGVEIEGETYSAVIDTLSPISLWVSEPTQTRTRENIYLVDSVGARRVRGRNIELFRLSPCSEDNCSVGVGGAFDILLGATLLRKASMILDLGNQEIAFAPDSSGTSEEQGNECRVVFPSILGGGGLFRVGETEVPYEASRLVVGACFAGDESSSNPVEQGVDIEFVISTAFARTVISESAYERYRVTDTMAPALDALPSGTLSIPQGELQGKVATLLKPRLVAQGADYRGPCGEVRTNLLMRGDGCVSGEECPCRSGSECPAAGYVDVLANGASIDVLVISDLTSLLLGLREELRPRFPEVDGVLGTDLLSAVQLEVDYPNNRLIGRCSDLGACLQYPEIRRAGDRAYCFE